MSDSTTYQVYVQKKGKWEMHRGFAGSDKDKAVQEAMRQETQAGVDGVKVIRDVPDPLTGASQEYTFYQSNKNMEAATGAGAPAKAASPSPAPAPLPKSLRKPSPTQLQKAKQARQKPTHQQIDREAAMVDAQLRPPRRSGIGTIVVVKLLLVTMISLIVATLITVVVGSSFDQIQIMNINIQGHTRSNVLFGLFVLAFVASAVPMALRFLSSDSLSARAKNPQRRARVTPPDEKPKITDPEEPPHAPANDDAADAGVSGAAQDKAGEVSDIGGAAKIPEQPLTGPAKEQLAALLGFAGNRIGELDGGKDKLDNYNRFGVSLFLAGASEGLCTEMNLDFHTKTRLLGACVQTIGFRKVESQRFADSYEQYLLADSRYMQMFQAGRAAMNTSLEGELKATDKPLANALAEWNKPKKKDEKQQIITVMFTDIVGSTALTQSLGDEGAQKVVRTHNKIVRDALVAHNGKEIKHTGDGIMASFPGTSDGVQASIEIQQQAQKHTAGSPELPLRLKIGLHSGEAIAEDNDLFGTHVQLSARIVDKAGDGEIFLSETAHGICQGRGFTFANRGKFHFKGFAEPQVVYEVVWDPNKPLPPEPEPEAEAEAEIEPEPEAEAEIEPEPEAEAGIEPEAEIEAEAEAEAPEAGPEAAIDGVTAIDEDSQGPAAGPADAASRVPPTQAETPPAQPPPPEKEKEKEKEKEEK